MKVDLFTDEVFVFTPKGDVKSLPRGATPVDFAYAIHSDVGGRCVGAKVNGKIVPLRYKLKNGDTVEVLTSPQAHPSKDWLTFVKTSRAQQRIRGVHQAAAAREEPAAGPRAGWTRSSSRFGLNLNKLLKSGELKPHRRGARLPHRGRPAGRRGLRQGRARTSSSQRLVPPEKLAESEKQKAQGEPARLAATERLRDQRCRRLSPGHRDGQEAGRRARAESGVQIGGVDDVLVRFGRCCNPVPGDPIVGLHHPRPRRDGAHRRAASRRSPRTPSGGWTWPGTCAGTSSARSRCGCSPPTGPGCSRTSRTPSRKKGVNISPGQLPGHRRRPRGEHLRGHHLRPQAAHRR